MAREIPQTVNAAPLGNDVTARCMLLIPGPREFAGRTTVFSGFVGAVKTLAS